MTHLSPSEFVDLIDGTLPPVRAAHADACAECRAQAVGLQSALREAHDAGDVPEPSSPFFWDRLSANVRAAVADTKPAAGVRGLVPLATAAALIVAVSAGVLMTRHAETPSSPGLTAPVERARVGAADEAALDPATGEVWDVLTAVASDMQIDEASAAGMSVHPSAIDRAVQRMTPDELNELGRLLQSQLKGSGN